MKVVIEEARKRFTIGSVFESTRTNPMADLRLAFARLLLDRGTAEPIGTVEDAIEASAVLHKLITVKLPLFRIILRRSFPV